MFKKLTLSLITIASLYTIQTFAKPARAVFAIIPSVSNEYIKTSTIEEAIRAIKLQGVTWQNSKILKGSESDHLQISADVDADLTKIDMVVGAIKVLPHVYDAAALYIEPTTLTGKMTEKFNTFAKNHPYILSLPMIPTAGFLLWKSSSSTAYRVITSALLTGMAWSVIGGTINAAHNNPYQIPVLVK